MIYLIKRPFVLYTIIYWSNLWDYNKKAVSGSETQHYVCSIYPDTLSTNGFIHFEGYLGNLTGLNIISVWLSSRQGLKVAGSKIIRAPFDYDLVVYQDKSDGSYNLFIVGNNWSMYEYHLDFFGTYVGFINSSPNTNLSEQTLLWSFSTDTSLVRHQVTSDSVIQNIFN